MVEVKKKRDLGLVGCGDWGRYILRDLASLGCRVSVVAQSKRSHRNAVEGGCERVVTRIEDLPGVDGVVVATTTSSHAAVLEALLPLNVPIFVEKPMTNDIASATRLANEAPERLFVMDKWRYHPGVELLASIARSGDLGPVVGLHTMRVGWGNPHQDTDAIWVLAPHDLSIALEVLGELPSPRIALADRDRNGPVGLIGILGVNPWFAFEVSARHPVQHREVRLLCRDGVAVLPDGYSDRLLVYRGAISKGNDASRAEEVRYISSELPLLRELRAFIEFLDGGQPPRSSAREGAAIVQRVAELRVLANLDSPSAQR